MPQQITLKSYVDSLNLQCNMGVVSTILLRFITGIDDAYACQHSLKEAVDFKRSNHSAKTFRLALLDIAYMRLNLKFYASRLALKRVTLDQAYELAKHYSIPECDVSLVHSFSNKVRHEVKTHKNFAEHTADTYSTEALRSVYALYDRIYPSLIKFIRARTFAKLRFISKSSNVEFHDFHIDLVCKSLQVYLKLMPTSQSDAYIENYIKRALSNHINNMIKHNVCEKRKRLAKGKADGFGGNNFDLIVVSENQLAIGENGEVVSYEDMQSTDTDDQNRLFDDKVLCSQIFKRYGTTKTRRKVLELLSGIEDVEFTEFLKRRRLATAKRELESNDEHFIPAICEFLKIEENTVRQFITKIRDESEYHVREPISTGIRIKGKGKGRRSTVFSNVQIRDTKPGIQKSSAVHSI